MQRSACLRVLTAAVLLSCLAAGATPVAARAEPGAPLVAAAASLRFAMEDLEAQYRAETGRRVRVTLGASGNLARQVRAGAPFELLLAADEQFVLDLHRDGFTRDAGDVYARGRLALIVPQGGELSADGSLQSLAAALAAGAIRRFAIANPDHAPYGMRAREALQHAGLWETIEPRLVLGENVGQAAQFALSGNASGGLVALSLALAPSVASRSSHALVPEDRHQPLNQRMVLLADATPAAESFQRWLLTPPAQAILARHGYGLP